MGCGRVRVGRRLSEFGEITSTLDMIPCQLCPARFETTRGFAKTAPTAAVTSDIRLHGNQDERSWQVRGVEPARLAQIGEPTTSHPSTPTPTLLSKHTMSPLFSTRPILLLSLLLITALVTSVIVLGLDADYVSKYANVYSTSSSLLCLSCYP